MEASEQVNIEVPDEGDFMEVPFARTFFGMCRERRSGRLDIRDKPAAEGGKILKRVVMAGGSSFFVKGGTVQETLGSILLARSKITQEQHDELNNETGGDHNKIEEKILSGSVINAGELPELVSIQAGMKIKSLFALIRGFYEFKAESADQLRTRYVLVQLSPEKVLVEGVREHYPAGRAKKEFPDIEKKGFHLSREGKESLNRFGLPPGVLRWLNNLPEGFSWSQVLTKAPLDKDEAAKLLLALYFAGVISLPQGEEDFPVGRAYEKDRKAPKPEQKKPAEAEAKQKEKPAPAEDKKPKEEPKLPVEEMLDKNLSDDEMLKVIDEYLKVVSKKDRDYFEILGVNENTPPNKIKSIYFKFARKFHPDSRPDLFKNEVKEKVEDIFTVVTEAYDTLSDADGKAEYIKQKKSQLSKEDMDKASRALEAEMEFQKAEVLLKRSKWEEAAGLLERAVELEPEEPEYKMYLAWARYKSRGVSEAAKTKSVINSVLKERPKLADGFYYLAMMAKGEGDLAEAQQHLAKATKMKPHDVDIKRELQIIQRRLAKPEAAPKKGGLFSRKK